MESNWVYQLLPIIKIVLPFIVSGIDKMKFCVAGSITHHRQNYWSSANI